MEEFSCNFTEKEIALLFFGIEADEHDDLSALADLAKGKG
jgi:hypothetical protein|tara:strand:- start:553 stop:672 length:120 start_codon:yes stop_codon:yes gene_type:complete